MNRFLVVTGVFLVAVGTIVTITASAGSRWQFDNRSDDTATIADISPLTTAITINDGYTIADDFSEGALTFHDPGLEAAIRQAINKPQGPIYITDLSFLTELEADNRGITDLTGLENCLNLEWLSLQGNNISDISALAGLTSLKWLDLSSNNIVDIWGLGGLAKLEGFDLSDNNISDVIILIDVLANLKWVGLNNSNIGDDEHCFLEVKGVTVYR